MRLKFNCSYRDEIEYKAMGHPTVNEIEAYRATADTIRYIESDFNHCGDPTAFERNILSRQGGALVRLHDYKVEQHWTPEVYLEFVSWLDTQRCEEEIKWAMKKSQYGEHWTPLDPPRPIPAPIYFNHTSKRYELEPWFDFPIRAAADSLAKLRHSDVYRVMEQTPEEWRRPMFGYITQQRQDLAAEVLSCFEELKAEKAVQA